MEIVEAIELEAIFVFKSKSILVFSKRQFEINSEQ